MSNWTKHSKTVVHNSCHDTDSWNTHVGMIHNEAFHDNVYHRLDYSLRLQPNTQSAGVTGYATWNSEQLINR